MRPFEYASVTSLDELTTRLGQAGDGRIRPLAGGTDLLTLMKADIVAPAQLLDIKRIAGLADQTDDPSTGLTLGALMTLASIETSSIIQQRYPLLAEAAAAAATPQLRNMATLGGNLLQRPRCWYFRSQHFHCWLKGGDHCPAYSGENQLHALFGGGPCYAVHPSDLAPALIALDAEVRLRGRQGERSLPIGDFFAQPTDERRTETTLQHDELVLAVRVPPPRGDSRSTYLKAMDRKVWSFALVSLAAVVHIDQTGRRIEAARLVLGGVAPVPWRLSDAEQALAGEMPSDRLFEQVADTALAGAQPLEHNAYKIPLAKALIRQALTQLTSGTS